MRTDLQSRRARGRSSWSALALTWAFALLNGAGCDARGPARAQEGGAEMAIPVRLAAVMHERQPLPVRVSGMLVAKRELDLAFKTGGIVRRVLVEEGARVRKGQTLATIDATEISAQLSQANEQLARASRDLSRARTLSEQRSIASVDALNAESAFFVARAAAQAAAFNERHSVITAPSDGVINRRLVQVGEVVGPGEPMFHLSTSEDGATARVGVSDRDFLGMQLGTKARIALDAAPGDVLRGVVSRLPTLASPLTGTFEVEIDIDDERAARLPAGLVVRVEIERFFEATATVPIASLTDADGDRGAVYVVSDSRARRVPVRVHAVTGDVVLLASGAEDADHVVAAGATQLVDGALVRVLP